MSTSVFPFLFLAPEAGGDFAESYVPVDEYEESQGGRGAAIARAASLRYAAAGTCILPDNSGNVPTDFWTFLAARSGRVDSFLFKGHGAAFRISHNESLGTAAGGGGETFALDYKFVDSTTLRVFVGGVEQALTTDYSLSGNNSAPIITTTASFDTGTVTAYYEFYQTVRFAEMPRAQPRTGGAVSYGQQEIAAFTLALVETSPGARLV